MDITFTCNFRNHLNRKNICSPLLEDISIEIIKHYNFTDPPNPLQITPNNSKIPPNSENDPFQNSLQITQITPNVYFSFQNNSIWS